MRCISRLELQLQLHLQLESELESVSASRRQVQVRFTANGSRIVPGVCSLPWHRLGLVWPGQV